MTPPTRQDGTPDVPPLITEATRRAGLIWLALPPAGGRPAWHIWRDGAAYVVSAGDEQPLPGLMDLDQVVVTVPSKDNRSRLVSWRAHCTRLLPGSPEWDAVVPDLVTARLNLPDPATAPARWARESAIVRLEPTGELVGRTRTGGGGVR